MKTQQLSSSKQVILALTDDKAGHETQTQGIIQLLNQNQEYKVEWIHLEQPNHWLYRLLRWLLNFHIDINWLRYFVSDEMLQRLDDLPVAYIISSGGNTLIPNVLLKKYFLIRKYNVKNIVASSLRGISPKKFDVIFTVREQQASLEHYLYYPIAPNKMTSLQLTQDQARKNLEISSHEQVITVLIGADSEKVGICSPLQWAKLLQNIRLQFPESRLLLTTSRRTSMKFETELRNYCEKMEIFKAQDKMTWVANGQACDIKNYIKAANWVVCSQDSTSMMAEIMMAEKPLIVVYNQTEMKDPLIDSQLSMLEEKGWLFKLDIEHLSEINQYLDHYHQVVHSHNLYKALNNHLASEKL
ncbi:ELM1/GtrOC1 family putative glycosyltransferase [Acinetobacter baumannii]|nr:ELM1/GtrOC1 family putative glycosyltransferase [Acinetobacter baumannii]